MNTNGINEQLQYSFIKVFTERFENVGYVNNHNITLSHSARFKK